jgi:hypothetical protein
MKKADSKIVRVSIDPMVSIPTELLAQAQALALLDEMNINYDDIPPTPPGVAWTKPGSKASDVKNESGDDS